MRLWISSSVERIRVSFFFLPMAAVVLAIFAAFGTVWLDSGIDNAARLPLVLTSTVESARSILSTIAGATITFAGVAFSISLLVIQLGSSQFSPRVVHTLFRDSFNKRVMALVVGTFTYCVVVLRSVRSPLESGGDAVIPNLSVAIALILGIGAILATVAFINHSAHSMDVSEILDRAARESIEQVRRERWAPDEGVADGPSSKAAIAERSEPASYVVRFDRSGWVQQIDLETFGQLVPDGGFIELHTTAGSFAVDGTLLCSMSHEPDDVEAFDDAVRSAVGIGANRTAQQDTSYGLRQIVDVALRGLSPGINDPTTAQDAIFHAATVLYEVLRRDAPPRVRCLDHGGFLLQPDRMSYQDFVQLAFEEIRRSAAPHPAVCVYVLEAIRLVREALDADGLGDRAPELEVQARLMLQESERSDVVGHDHELVRHAYRQRFERTG